LIVDVAAAAAEIERGGVVAYPTETVYGLGVDAASPAALDRLRRLKGRTPAKGLSILVADLEVLQRWAPELPELALCLARRFWPGPLTLVVPVGDETFARIATEHGVGFRCSSHPAAAALVRATCRPVVSTSCNRSEAPPCLCVEEIEAAFGPTLPILGGERAGGQPPSTVVAIQRDGHIQLLREGAVSLARIREESL